MAIQKHRLVTRSDFDGLVCGMLLRELDLIDEIRFVHPKDMQDGIVPIAARDIVTNLPHVEGCHLAFDHHASEMSRKGERSYSNHVIDPSAASAARVVYDDHGGAAAFPRVRADLLAAVDQADSAQFTREEILDPKGWVLLNFLMDSRTGLGRFREFRIPNYDLMMQLIERCRDASIDEVLALPDVKERVELYAAQREDFVAQLRRCTVVHGRLALIDLRDEAVIHAGNRLHGLRAVPWLHHFGARDLGPEEAEHRVRDRQVDPRPVLAGGCRRRLLGAWRRPPGGRNLPGPERPGRSGQGGAGRHAVGNAVQGGCLTFCRQDSVIVITRSYVLVWKVETR